MIINNSTGWVLDLEGVLTGEYSSHTKDAHGIAMPVGDDFIETSFDVKVDYTWVAVDVTITSYSGWGMGWGEYGDIWPGRVQYNSADNGGASRFAIAYANGSSSVMISGQWYNFKCRIFSDRYETYLDSVLIETAPHSSATLGQIEFDIAMEDSLNGTVDPAGPKITLKNFVIRGRRGLPRMFNYQFGDEIL